MSTIYSHTTSRSHSCGRATHAQYISREGSRYIVRPRGCVSPECRRALQARRICAEAICCLLPRPASDTMVRICSGAVGRSTTADDCGGTAGVRYHSRGLWCAAGRRCHRPRLWWHGQPAVLRCAGVVAQAGAAATARGCGGTASPRYWVCGLWQKRKGKKTAPGYLFVISAYQQAHTQALGAHTGQLSWLCPQVSCPRLCRRLAASVSMHRGLYRRSTSATSGHGVPFSWAFATFLGKTSPRHPGSSALCVVHPPEATCVCASSQAR